MDTILMVKEEIMRENQVTMALEQTSLKRIRTWMLNSVVKEQGAIQYEVITNL
jgi:hypothetical protein